jgi:hypothetical protein
METRQMADPSTPALPQIGEETARELLAVEYDRAGYHRPASRVRQGQFDDFDTAAIRAILSALGPPPTEVREDIESTACPECGGSVFGAHILDSKGQPVCGAMPTTPPTEGREADDEFMSVSIDRDGNVASHNAYDANFDEMVDATRKIIAALQSRLDNRVKCPFAAGKELRNAEPATPPMRDREEIADGERSVAQFFFEVGYGACFAEAYIRNGGKVPWPMSDVEVERAWSIAGEAHDDPEEFSRYLALATPPSPCCLGVVEALEPFAKAADIRLCGSFGDHEKFSSFDIGHKLTFGDLRRARTALQSHRGEGR